MKIKTFLFKSHKNSIKSHKSNNNNDIISYCFILKTITKYFLNYINLYLIIGKNMSYLSSLIFTNYRMNFNYLIRIIQKMRLIIKCSYKN